MGMEKTVGTTGITFAAYEERQTLKGQLDSFARS